MVAPEPVASPTKHPKRRRRVRERLAEAQADLTLVRIDRGDDLDRIDGYVVCLGTEWLLLAALDGAIVLDGHIALRVKDVRAVRRRPTGDMVRQALTLRGQWPPAPPESQLDLDSTFGLLASLAAQPSVTLHPEHDEPDICFVGALQQVGDRSLQLLEITPRGVWTQRPTKHRLVDITRVDIGGRYEQALLSVAGPAPQASSTGVASDA